MANSRLITSVLDYIGGADSLLIGEWLLHSLMYDVDFCSNSAPFISRYCWFSVGCWLEIGQRFFQDSSRFCVIHWRIHSNPHWTFWRISERERERERRPLELNPVHWSAGNGAEQSTDRITVWSMIIHCNSIPTPTTSSTPMIQSIMANGPYGAPVSRYHILPCVHWGPSPLSLPRNVFSLIRDSFSVEQSPRWVSRASWTRNDGIHIYIGQRFDTSNSRRRRNWVLNGVEWGGGVRSRHLWSGRRTSPQHRLPLGAPWI